MVQFITDIADGIEINLMNFVHHKHDIQVQLLVLSSQSIAIYYILSQWSLTVQTLYEFKYQFPTCTHGVFQSMFKSPRYTGGDFLCFCTGSYAAGGSLPTTDSCSRDNFIKLFGLLSFFGTIVGPDLQITRLDFGRFSLWPWLRFFKVKYGIWYISAKKWSDCHETKSKHID